MLESKGGKSYVTIAKESLNKTWSRMIAKKSQVFAHSSKCMLATPVGSRVEEDVLVQVLVEDTIYCDLSVLRI